MATKTRAQLVIRAAQRIGVLAAGQTLSAEDASLIDDQVDPMAEDLSARQVVSLADTTEFDQSVFLPLADILGWWVSGDFGVSVQELLGLNVDGSVDGAAEKRLRKVNATRPLGEPVQSQYF